MRERDERHVPDDEIEAVFGELRCERRAGDVASVEPFEATHTRIAAHLGAQLAVPDLDADDTRRTPMQERVGETTGALTDVEAGEAADIDRAALERALELPPAARHEAQLGVVGDLHLAVFGQVFTRFARQGPDRLPGTPAHRAGLNQSLRRRPSGCQALGQDQLVGAHAGSNQ